MNMSLNLILAVVVGLLALVIAVKIGRFVFKVLFGLLALAMIAAAAWWFLIGH
jgi:hypothetical protein